MNPACTKCGFSYAWDGITCGHCHYQAGQPIIPVDHDDLFEARFEKRALRWHLTLFSDLKPKWRDLIWSRAVDHVRGRPVLGFIYDADRWTLLTTRQILSWYDDEMRDVPLDGLTDVQPDSFPGSRASQKELVRWKRSHWEYLRLMHESGSTVVWVPSGNPAWALWNLLLPIASASR